MLFFARACGIVCTQCQSVDTDCDFRHRPTEEGQRREECRKFRFSYAMCERSQWTLHTQLTIIKRTIWIEWNWIDIRKTTFMCIDFQICLDFKIELTLNMASKSHFSVIASNLHKKIIDKNGNIAFASQLCASFARRAYLEWAYCSRHHSPLNDKRNNKQRAWMRAIKMKSESQWQINIEVSVGFGSLNFNIFCPLWMCVVVRVRRRHPPFLPNLYMSIVVVFQERVQQSEKILLPLYVCSHFEEVAGRSVRCAPSAAVTLCKNADCFPFIIILNLFLWMFFSLFLISIRIYF